MKFAFYIYATGQFIFWLYAWKVLYLKPEIALWLAVCNGITVVAILGMTLRNSYRIKKPRQK